MKWKSGFAVQVIDTSTDQIIKTIPLDGGALTTHVTTDGKLLVAQYRFGAPSASTGGMPTPMNGKLLVFAGESEDFRKLGEVKVGMATLTLASTPDGKKAFAANQWSGTVTVVDLETLTAERTLDVDTVRRAEKDMLNGAHGMAVIA